MPRRPDLGVIPRFDTLDDLKPEELRACLTTGVGAVVVERVLWEPLAALDRADLMAFIGECRKDGSLLETDGSLRPRGILRAHFALTRLLNLEPLIRLVGEIIGSPPTIGSFGANVVLPGAPGQGAHMDYPYFGMPETARPRLMPPLCVQVILALDEFKKDNGPTMILPWSHDLNAWPDQEAFNLLATRITMPRGGAVIFHGAVKHGVAPNASNESRAAYLMGFHPYWVRPPNDPEAAPEHARIMLRSLLGLDFKERFRKDISRMGYGMARPATR